MEIRDKQRLVGVTIVVAFVLITLFLLSNSTERESATATNSQESGESSESVQITPVDSDLVDRTGADLEFIDLTFPVLASWSYEALEPHLNLNTIEGMGKAEIEQVLNVLALELGELESYGDPEFMADLSDLNLQPNADLSVYNFQANFVRAAANVFMAVQMDGNQRRIYAFNIQTLDEPSI